VVARRGVRDLEVLDPRHGRVEREGGRAEPVQGQRVARVAYRDPPPHGPGHAQRGTGRQHVADRPDRERRPEREEQQHVPARGSGVLAQHRVGDDGPEGVPDDDRRLVGRHRRGERVVDHRPHGRLVQVRPDVAREEHDDGAAQARDVAVQRGEQQVDPRAAVGPPGALRARRDARSPGPQHLLGDGHHEGQLVVGQRREGARPDRVHRDRRRRAGAADEPRERVPVVDERRVLVAQDQGRPRPDEACAQRREPRAVELLGVEALVVAAVDEHESGHAPEPTGCRRRAEGLPSAPGQPPIRRRYR